MKIAERIIFLIYTLLLAFLSLGVILISLRLIPLDLIGTNIAKIEGNLKIGLIGAVFFVASFGFFLKNLMTKPQKEFLIHNNEMGDIRVSLKAIESLVEKTVKNINGVKDVKADASLTEANSLQTLTATIKAAISLDVHIPTVTAEMQKSVRESVKETVGIELNEIKIIVTTISTDFKAKHKVQ